jgi:hypothetical protein
MCLLLLPFNWALERHLLQRRGTHFIVYTIHYILYTIYYTTILLYYILYTIYYILYTIYYIPLTFCYTVSDLRQSEQVNMKLMRAQGGEVGQQVAKGKVRFKTY